MTCKICESNSVSLKFNLTEKHGVYSCSGCSAQFMDPQLNDEEIIRLYSEGYYASWGVSGNSENESAKQMKIATFLLRLELIKQHVASGKIMDIGCATGYFLEAAKTLNYEPFGIELSEYSSGIAKKKFGTENIFNGKLEDCNFKQKMFNVITMFDLIEHVRSPRETLSKAAELLSDDGVIVITTPDNSSTSNKIMGKRWTHYKQEHFYYFNIKSLSYVAQQCNLKVVYSESSKKALNITYLHTQLNVYKHWLFTPIINLAFAILPKRLADKNFHIGIGELTVALKKNK